MLFFILAALMAGVIPLPSPFYEGTVSVEQAIFERRSQRAFSDDELTKSQLSQLLFSAYGISDEEMGFHTVPSAGATFPMEIYAIVRSVEDIEAGIYRYIPSGHEMRLVRKGDFSDSLSVLCLSQPWVAAAQVNIVLCARFERTTNHYGQRGIRYVYQESGHIGQNVYLQAQALGLGAVAIGAFDDSGIEAILGDVPIYIITVGKPINQ